LFTVLLATSAMTGQSEEGSYGGFGSYGGSYGSYAGGRGSCGLPGSGMIYPWGGQPSVYWELNSCQQKTKDKVAELEESNKFLAQKLRKLEEQVEIAQSQVKANDSIDDKLATFKAQVLAAVEATKSAPPANDDLRVSIVRIEQQLSKLTDDRNTSTRESAANQALAARLDVLEKVGKEKWGDKAFIDALDAIRKELANLAPGQTVAAAAKSSKDNFGLATNRSMIIVYLPADATLFVNEQASSPGANVRSFITPEMIDLTKNYYYTVRVELNRNNRTLTETQKVYFHPGREVEVNFNHLDRLEAATQAAQTSQIKSKTN
jgi:uncharacterized protein (TIGR03000 family)